MSSDIINTLGSRFHARYSKNFANWNSKVIRSLDENGGYDVPHTDLSDGGFAEAIGNEQLPPVTALSSEKNVARVVTKTEKFKSITTRYVIRIPWSAIEETHNNPEYFNEYFDNIVQIAINNYVNRYGSPDVVRYGDKFIDYVSSKGEVFRDDGSGDHLDLIFSGVWASNEPVNKN